jgi:hypothetical protein
MVLAGDREILHGVKGGSLSPLNIECMWEPGFFLKGRAGMDSCKIQHLVMYFVLLPILELILSRTKGPLHFEEEIKKLKKKEMREVDIYSR